MYVLVIAQVIFAAESLHTSGTDKRSFVGVCADVNFEVVRLGELTSAEAADILR